MSLDESFAEHRMAGSTDFEGRHWLGIIARKTYWLANGRPAVKTDRSEVPNCTDDELMELVECDDLALLKPATDVLLVGPLEAAAGATMVETSLTVGPAHKAVRAWGKRRLEKIDGRARITAPEPLGRLRLTLDHAFGGCDRQAEQASAQLRRRSVGIHESPPDSFVYPRNPWGRGYLVDGSLDRLIGTEIPQLEDPTSPIDLAALTPTAHDAWTSRPAAAVYGPLNRYLFPRCQSAASIGVPGWVREVEEGSLDSEAAQAELGTLTLHPKCLQSAPSGLGNALLQGGERVELRGFRRSPSALVTSVPDSAPRLTMTLPGMGRRSLQPFLKTLLFEPDADRLSVTWSGRLEVLMPYCAQDVDSIEYGVEW